MKQGSKIARSFIEQVEQAFPREEDRMPVLMAGIQVSESLRTLDSVHQIELAIGALTDLMEADGGTEEEIVDRCYKDFSKSLEGVEHGQKVKAATAMCVLALIGVPDEGKRLIIKSMKELIG